MKLSTSLVLLAAAPALLSVAPQDARLIAESRQLPAAPSVALERALNTVDIDELSADLHFLASDALGGRDSPSPGLRIAARFIRARLVRLGMTPGAENGFFYEYSLPSFALDVEKTSASVGGKSFTFGDDYFLSFRALGTREVSGPVVFGGGLSADDTENVDFEGKWVLAQTNGGLSRRRLNRPTAQGALGVIVVPGPEYDGEPFKTVHGRWMARMKEPSARRMARKNATPVLYMSAESERHLMSLAPAGELKPGQDLGFEFSESCAYGQTDGTVLENVCALWPGSDPVLKNEVIIISAHYDHVGQRENGDIYNGADDNGSGTTGLLALAEALTEYGPMRRTVMLMWVSAEEKGLLGSAAWTKNPWLPEGMKAICNVNIDMIGRNATNELLITPTKNHDAYSKLTQVVEANAEAEGFTRLKSADNYWRRSDQYNFSVNMDLPVAFLFADVHEDYHQPTDTPDKINYEKMRNVVRLVIRMLADLQDDVLDL
ncbi:MAG: M28 family peptidase [bacterium]|nr:M28 family peptidase [bacterium]